MSDPGEAMTPTEASDELDSNRALWTSNGPNGAYPINVLINHARAKAAPGDVAALAGLAERVKGVRDYVNDYRALTADMRRDVCNVLDEVRDRLSSTTAPDDLAAQDRRASGSLAAAYRRGYRDSARVAAHPGGVVVVPDDLAVPTEREVPPHDGKPGAWITEEFERARERMAAVPPHARPMWTPGSFGDRRPAGPSARAVTPGSSSGNRDVAVARGDLQRIANGLGVPFDVNDRESVEHLITVATPLGSPDSEAPPPGCECAVCAVRTATPAATAEGEAASLLRRIVCRREGDEGEDDPFVMSTGRDPEDGEVWSFDRLLAALRTATPASPAGPEIGDNDGGDPVALRSKLARSTWNYRVVRQVTEGETLYGVHEAYDDGTSWTADPVAPVAETVDGLREVLRAMSVAPEFDVIDGDPESTPTTEVGAERGSVDTP